MRTQINTLLVITALPVPVHKREQLLAITIKMLVIKIHDE